MSEIKVQVNDNDDGKKSVNLINMRSRGQYRRQTRERTIKAAQIKGLNPGGKERGMHEVTTMTRVTNRAQHVTAIVNEVFGLGHGDQVKDKAVYDSIAHHLSLGGFRVTVTPEAGGVQKTVLQGGFRINAGPPPEGRAHILAKHTKIRANLEFEVTPSKRTLLISSWEGDKTLLKEGITHAVAGVPTNYYIVPNTKGPYNFEVISLAYQATVNNAHRNQWVLDKSKSATHMDFLTNRMGSDSSHDHELLKKDFDRWASNTYGRTFDTWTQRERDREYQQWLDNVQKGHKQGRNVYTHLNPKDPHSPFTVRFGNYVPKVEPITLSNGGQAAPHQQANPHQAHTQSPPTGGTSQVNLHHMFASWLRQQPGIGETEYNNIINVEEVFKEAFSYWYNEEYLKHAHGTIMHQEEDPEKSFIPRQGMMNLGHHGVDPAFYSGRDDIWSGQTHMSAFAKIQQQRREAAMRNSQTAQHYQAQTDPLDAIKAAAAAIRGQTIDITGDPVSSPGTGIDIDIPGPSPMVPNPDDTWSRRNPDSAHRHMKDQPWNVNHPAIQRVAKNLTGIGQVQTRQDPRNTKIIHIGTADGGVEIDVILHGKDPRTHGRVGEVYYRRVNPQKLTQFLHVIPRMILTGDRATNDLPIVWKNDFSDLVHFVTAHAPDRLSELASKLMELKKTHKNVLRTGLVIRAATTTAGHPKAKK